MNSRETFTDLAIRAALMVAVYVVFAAMLPSYHTVRGAAALLDGGVLIGLTALGIGITMIAGEFDLSVGSLAAVIGVLTVNLIIAGMSIIPAIAIAVAVACAFGALQGFVIAVTGINSLVFTIGTLIGLRGFAMIISNENSVTIPIPRLGETDFLAQRVSVCCRRSASCCSRSFSSRTCSSATPCGGARSSRPAGAGRRLEPRACPSFVPW